MGTSVAGRAPEIMEPGEGGLERAFPRMGVFPRVRLCELPTPVEPLSIPGTPADKWVKRDDRTSPIYGGNKPRKLEYILGDALAKGADVLLTSGYLGTNHGLATAIHAARLGLRTRIILVRQGPTEHVRRNLLLLRHHDAELIYARNMVHGALLTALEMRRLRAAGRRPYFVPPGGSSAIGTLGFVQAAFELRDQINAGILPVPDCVYVAHGSSGSLVGLALGFRLCGVKTEVMGVRVVAKYWTNGWTARRLFRGARQLLYDQSAGIPDVGDQYMHSINGYFGPGYGIPSSVAIEAKQMAMDGAGLYLDPAYTSKTLAAMLDHARREPWKRFLLWHTYNSAPLDESVVAANRWRDLDPKLHWVFEGARESA